MRYLDLTSNRIGAEGLRALAESPHATSLEALALGDDRMVLTPELLRSPVFQRLAWLELGGGTNLAKSAAALTKAPPPGLRQLRLSYGDLDAGVRNGMARLRAALPGCAIGY